VGVLVEELGVELAQHVEENVQRQGDVAVAHVMAPTALDAGVPVVAGPLGLTPDLVLGGGKVEVLLVADSYRPRLEPSDVTNVSELALLGGQARDLSSPGCGDETHGMEKEQ